MLRGRICASAKTGIRSASPMLASMVPMHRRGAQGSCAVLQRSEQALQRAPARESLVTAQEQSWCRLVDLSHIRQYRG